MRNVAENKVKIIELLIVQFKGEYAYFLVD
jgi:hypothetical protein